ncbi:Uncharacterised protein [Moraxella caprae]|uniref:Uncharacterized protein n=1 Tax=Moraxella caprae TaxID=90240 RepID=A0A378QYS3_9GAMM|nr:Uncharacterised protein [Moraxella caprae]
MIIIKTIKKGITTLLKVFIKFLQSQSFYHAKLSQNNTKLLFFSKLALNDCCVKNLREISLLFIHRIKHRGQLLLGFVFFLDFAGGKTVGG